MSRKRLDAKGVAQVRELLLSGKTASETAEFVGMSAATINNLKAQFKKQGDVFPNNRGRRPGKIVVRDKTLAGSTNKLDSEYVYLINGTKITIYDKPKSLEIGKNKMVVNF